jgi:hypothetical protein
MEMLLPDRSPSGNKSMTMLNLQEIARLGARQAWIYGSFFPHGPSHTSLLFQAWYGVSPVACEPGCILDSSSHIGLDVFDLASTYVRVYEYH